jgi:hypothetical protein
MNKKNISTALLVAIIVGTMLNVVNSYDVFIDGDFSTKNTIKIILHITLLFCCILQQSRNKMETRNNRQ